MQPPSRWLAPGAGTAMPPPLGRQGAAPGDQRTPPAPPPPRSAPRADGGRLKTRRPRIPPEEAAAPGVGGHHGRGRRPHALPAAGRRQTGGAQDGANEAARSEAGPGKTGAPTRAGGFAPPPPPPRRTDPLAADRTAPNVGGRPATPTAQVYPRAARRRPQMAGRRPTGRGGGPSPPPPPPSLGATGAALRPPGAEGAPPLPQKGPRRRGGGMRLDLHNVRPSSPSCLLPRGSRPTGKPTPVRRSNARTKPGGGSRRRTRTVWRARPPRPSHDHSPFRESRGGVSGLQGPPGERSTGRPSSPPTPGRPR